MVDAKVCSTLFFVPSLFSFHFKVCINFFRYEFLLMTIHFSKIWLNTTLLKVSCYENYGKGFVIPRSQNDYFAVYLVNRVVNPLRKSSVEIFLATVSTQWIKIKKCELILTNAPLLPELVYRSTYCNFTFKSTQKQKRMSYALASFCFYLSMQI